MFHGINIQIINTHYLSVFFGVEHPNFNSISIMYIKNVCTHIFIIHERTACNTRHLAKDCCFWGLSYQCLHNNWGLIFIIHNSIFKIYKKTRLNRLKNYTTRTHTIFMFPGLDPAYEENFEHKITVAMLVISTPIG